MNSSWKKHNDILRRHSETRAVFRHTATFSDMIIGENACFCAICDYFYAEI